MHLTASSTAHALFLLRQISRNFSSAFLRKSETSHTIRWSSAKLYLGSFLVRPMSKSNSARLFSLSWSVAPKPSGLSLAKRLGKPRIVFRVLRNNTRPVPCLSAISRIKSALVDLVSFLPLANSEFTLARIAFVAGN